MHTEPASRPVSDLSLLSPGDIIEARRGNVRCYRGRVQSTAPGLGLVWIREHPGNSRRAVSAEDFSIHLAGAPQR